MAEALLHPYRDRPSTAFWKTAVADVGAGELDPLLSVPFTIGKSDKVATAGSCFAQHISRALIAEGISFLQTEKTEPATAAKLPTYSARYGNIYTSRHLRQLFQRAYGLFTPMHEAWLRPDGRYVDPFRPNEFEAGFATPEDVSRARDAHLAAVRDMFEACDVFVFTLGLTEVWICDIDGSAVPLPPGVVAFPPNGRATFSPKNLSVQELTDDLIAVIDDIRQINPSIRFIITVSPVPIVATFNDRHVLLSNTYTKSALRIVAQNAADGRRDVLYFPSYEIITGHPKTRYYDTNGRAVTSEGVAAVMKLFRRRILDNGENETLCSMRAAPMGPKAEPDPIVLMPTIGLHEEFKAIVCDEDMLALR